MGNCVDLPNINFNLKSDCCIQIGSSVTEENELECQQTGGDSEQNGIPRQLQPIEDPIKQKHVNSRSKLCRQKRVHF